MWLGRLRPSRLRRALAGWKLDSLEALRVGVTLNFGSRFLVQVLPLQDIPKQGCGPGQPEAGRVPSTSYERDAYQSGPITEQPIQVQAVGLPAGSEKAEASLSAERASGDSGTSNASDWEPELQCFLGRGVCVRHRLGVCGFDHLLTCSCRTELVWILLLSVPCRRCLRSL